MHEMNQRLSDKSPDFDRYNHLSTRLKAYRSPMLKTAGQITSTLALSAGDIRSGKFRALLYRFLAENIPAVNACLWTWVRLTGAPGRYEVAGGGTGGKTVEGERRLRLLEQNIYANAANRPTGVDSLLVDMLSSLFRDGVFGGFLTINQDGSGVDRFVPIDSAGVVLDGQGESSGLYLEREHGRVNLDRPDFYFLPLNGSVHRPLGQSIFRAIPFVAYIEQQLIDDMRRSSHNAGFHRLHVKITPPERLAGEADRAYVDRINEYFDSTVTMIRSCEVDDNPVTWDNVKIEQIGPDTARSSTSSWFLNHRAMIEEICAGTNLAPFLLGYSYGATNTWSSFKFDVVMRQVKSIQAEVARFLGWIGDIELALAGLPLKCRFVFDNTFAYQALDRVNIESARVENLLKLFQAGLIDEQTARERAGALL